MALLELQNRMNLAVHRGAAPEESDLLLNEKKQTLAAIKDIYGSASSAK